MITKLQYVEFLISPIGNFTSTVEFNNGACFIRMSSLCLVHFSSRASAVSISSISTSNLSISMTLWFCNEREVGDRADYPVMRSAQGQNRKGGIQSGIRLSFFKLVPPEELS